MNKTLLSNCLIQDDGDISLLNAIRRAMRTGQSSTISDKWRNNCRIIKQHRCYQRRRTNHWRDDVSVRSQWDYMEQQFLSRQWSAPLSAWHPSPAKHVRNRKRHHMYSYSQNCSLGHTSEDDTVEDTRLADLMCHCVEKATVWNEWDYVTARSRHAKGPQCAWYFGGSFGENRFINGYGIWTKRYYQTA